MFILSGPSGSARLTVVNSMLSGNSASLVEVFIMMESPAAQR